jgi:hypothetical protein
MEDTAAALQNSCKKPPGRHAQIKHKVQHHKCQQNFPPSKVQCHFNWQMSKLHFFSSDIPSQHSCPAVHNPSVVKTNLNQPQTYLSTKVWTYHQAVVNTSKLIQETVHKELL